MNNESNVANLSQRREQVQTNNAISLARTEGYKDGFRVGKMLYEYLVWALCLYGIVITTAYLVR